jgi:NTE family protein
LKPCSQFLLYHPAAPASPTRFRVAEPRRGLVLGAGGVLGAAWMTGALSSIAELTGFEGCSSEVVVGTSAGAVLGSFIARGVPTERLVRHQRRARVAGEPGVDRYGPESAPRSLPPSPRWGTVGSSKVLGAAVRRPRSVPAGAALSAMLPVGRGDLEPIGRLVREADGQETAWPTAPQLWIVATDFQTGRRVVFGRPDTAPATISEAVMASCAIPAWYRPMVIDGRRYVDGGACSATSADLLARLSLDEVYILAPMASFELDRPSSPLARIERQLRRVTTKRLQHEAAKLKAAGTAVTMLAPGPEDLTVIGANMMDPRRGADVFAVAARSCTAQLKAVLAERSRSGLSATG